ncbi:MAG: EAL domain-containing protein, partial [Polyangiales bacterium]
TTLCRDLGVRVVAEGIETAEEHDCLHRVGCDLMQGFLFGTPGPLVAATDM